jgi:hypothetical protein
MPLHDWSETPGWEGVHLLWMTELVRHLKDRLPPGFRAYLGAAPALTIGAPPSRPDAFVRTHAATQGQAAPVKNSAVVAPDEEIAVATLDPDPALHVERDGRLVAAVELVSPRNKDRPVARAAYTNRYLNYLFGGVHLLLVDVHHRPADFSFADAISRELQLANQPPLPPPAAVSYRVGEPAASGGRLLAIWRKPFEAGAPLPAIPLPLTTDLAITVELEATYMRAAADAYLA